MTIHRPVSSRNAVSDWLANTCSQSFPFDEFVAFHAILKDFRKYSKLSQ